MIWLRGVLERRRLERALLEAADGLNTDQLAALVLHTQEAAARARADRAQKHHGRNDAQS